MNEQHAAVIWLVFGIVVTIALTLIYIYPQITITL